MPLRLALLLVSAAGLAFQLALMRVFSLALWHHFAYLIISIALLGLGASGTFLALWPRRPPAEKIFALFSALFALAVPASVWLSQRIPFDPLLVFWSPRQWLALAAYYLVFFVPFFAVAAAVGALLVERARDAPCIYFYNLLGSGLGSLALVGFLFFIPVERSVLVVFALAAAGALLALPALGRRTQAAVVVLLAVTFYVFSFTDALAVRVSQYKSLSVALNLPGARIVEQRHSPLGRVDVLSSPAFRHAPGLSLASPARVPPQLGLFVDGESAGALTQSEDLPESAEFLDWTTNAAGYYAANRPAGARVLVLGAGGGSDVLLARYHGTRNVDAVELNRQLAALAAPYAREATWRITEARAFAESRRRTELVEYDLVQISLLDSLAASTAGVHALNEGYLYTVEAFGAYLSLLSPDGALVVTRWLKMPPRDELKLFATAVEALERGGAAQPGAHLALVRSWATATLIVKRRPFSSAELARLKQFCQSRLFDLDYYPGIREEEANHFNRLPRNYYFEAAQEILAGGARREAFFETYPFFIRPARDDRPYFNHFVRWRALPALLEAYGRQSLPLFEWGYLILLATLAQAAVISVALILLPLFFRRAPPGTAAASRARVLAYFLAIGLGYLFVEIVLIQKFVFFLANPIYAAAVVLAGVLGWSGLGSLSAERAERALGLPNLCRLIVIVALVAALWLPKLLPPLLDLPAAARIALTLALIAPLAFLMGMPFPLAWKRLEAARADVLPWAWGVNGCASVVATSLATLTAMSFGFTVVFAGAALLYLLAALTAPPAPR